MAETEKTQRMELRVTPSTKTLLSSAADMEGLSLTEFVISRMSPIAREVLAEGMQTDLTLAQRKLFIQSFLQPAPATEKLKSIHARRRARVNE